MMKIVKKIKEEIIIGKDTQLGAMKGLYRWEKDFI